MARFLSGGSSYGVAAILEGRVPAAKSTRYRSLLAKTYFA